jgi:hypothetical protein
MLTEAEVLAQAISKPVESTPDNEMEILFETTKSYQVGTEQITIRPFGFGELPVVISLLKGVGSQFAYYQSKGTLQSVESMMDIISAGGENLIQALALNTGKPRDFFNKLSPEVGMQVMQDFLMMNIGFFTQRVLPVIKGMK